MHGCSLRNQRSHVFVGKLRIDIEPHVRELQTDVGIKLVRGDLLEQLTVELDTLPRLGGIGHVLAEIVYRDTQADGIKVLRDPQSVFHLPTGDKSA